MTAEVPGATLTTPRTSESFHARAHPAREHCRRDHDAGAGLTGRVRHGRRGITISDRTRFGAAVVIDEAGHPLGVVTKTDVLVHARQRKPGLEPDDTPVTEFMTPAVFSVRPDTPARSVVEQLLALNVHHLFVSDAAGVIIGVISPVDVLRKLG